MRSMRPWYADTGALDEDVGNERCIARAKSVKSASISDAGAEKMLLPSDRLASILILRSIARLTKALGYVGFDAMIPLRPSISELITSGVVSLDVR